MPTALIATSVTTSVLSAMADAAAAEIMPRWRALTADEVRTKSADWDLVTDADVLAEQRLTVALSAILDIPVVGEEATATDPELVNLVAASDACWLVDPVDGTRNFVQGREDFACMVALVSHGRTVGAWITYPAVGREMHGAAGEGTFLDGVQVMAPAPTNPHSLRGAIGARAFIADPEAIRARAGTLGPAGDIRFCAGWDYLDIVEGTKDYVLFSRTLPWDHAPGSLLVQEAGMASARFDGSEYLPGDTAQGLLTAHPTVWTPVRDGLGLQ